MIDDTAYRQQFKLKNNRSIGVYHPLLSGECHDELVDAAGDSVHEGDGGVVKLEAFGQQRHDQVLGQ